MSMPQEKRRWLPWTPVAKVALLFGPFALLFAAEATLAPLNLFTFRQWEAVLPRQHIAEFAFFPTVELGQTELGDVHRYGQYVSPRLTRWQTDGMGFRNRESYSPSRTYCFATIGDSNTIGASLDQSEMLSEVLARKAGCPTYNAASANVVQRYFQRPEFAANPPRFLVLQTIAGHFYSDHAYVLFNSSGVFSAFHPQPSAWHRILSSAVRFIAPEDPRREPWVLEEVAARNASRQYVRARLGFTNLPSAPTIGPHNANRNIHTPTAATGIAPKQLGSARYPTASKEAAERDCPTSVRSVANSQASAAGCRLIAVVQSIAAAARAMGSDFILYLQPSSDELLGAGIAWLESQGQRIVHFPSSPTLPYGIDFDWYWAAADTHWHPRGVELAAELILLESQGQSAETALREINNRIATEMRSIQTAPSRQK
jgi:hypothetical protein